MSQRRSKLGMSQSRNKLGMSQSWSKLGMSQSRNKLGMSQSRSKLGMSQSRSKLGMSQSRSQLGMSQSRNKLGMSQSRSKLGMSQSRSKLGMSQRRSKLGMRQSPTECFTDSSRDNRQLMQMQCSTNCTRCSHVEKNDCQSYSMTWLEVNTKYDKHTLTKVGRHRQSWQEISWVGLHCSRSAWVAAASDQQQPSMCYRYTHGHSGNVSLGD